MSLMDSESNDNTLPKLLDNEIIGIGNITKGTGEMILYRFITNSLERFSTFLQYTLISSTSKPFSLNKFFRNSFEK